MDTKITFSSITWSKVQVKLIFTLKYLSNRLNNHLNFTFTGKVTQKLWQNPASPVNFHWKFVGESRIHNLPPQLSERVINAFFCQRASSKLTEQRLYTMEAAVLLRTSGCSQLFNQLSVFLSAQHIIKQRPPAEHCHFSSNHSSCHSEFVSDHTCKALNCGVLFGNLDKLEWATYFLQGL